jgi:hypothetical protein
MVVHWWRLRDAHWRRSLAFNATGGFLSAIVFITAGVTKFLEGAWVALLALCLFMLLTIRIRRHYDAVSRAIALHPHAVEVPKHSIAPSHADGAGRVTPAPTARDGAEGSAPQGAETEESPEELHHLIIVPVASLDLASMRALAYAASLEQPVLALHVSPSDDEAKRFLEYWQVWGDHLPVEVVVSPYRAIVAPMVNYIESLHRERPDLTLTVILPQLIVRHWQHRILHNRTAARLRRALRPLPKTVVTTVPFHLPN